MNIIEQQLKQLEEKFPLAEILYNGKNLGTLHIPQIKLPIGWNKSITDIYFYIPYGFPSACPQHFYTSYDLRLENGCNPRATQSIENYKYLMFYWRLDKWSPNYDTLLTYVRVIQNRFRQPI